MVPGVVAASGLQVSPTTVRIAAGHSADGIVLENTGTEVLHAQVRVFRWTQADGEDILEPTADLTISPPMLTLPPGGDQLVRVIRTGPPPARETSYRVVVDELPLPRDEATEGRPELRFVLRYSMPVFLAPEEPVAPAPMLQASLASVDGRRHIELRNPGNGHAQVSDLALVAPDGSRRVIAPGLSGYVLPGQWRRWLLPDGLAADPAVAFEARINGEAAGRPLALDR
ncbi:fimbrial biogenesis chaperone [Luteimonas sp. A501]